jgi:(4-O-methyl)-D-glucuronate---lignin esterase
MKISLSFNALSLAGALSLIPSAIYAAESTAVASAAAPAIATNSAAASSLGAADTATSSTHTNTAVIPRLNPVFLGRHTNFVEIAKKGDIDVLFMGDSITDAWRNRPPNGGQEVQQKYFGHLKVANFGIAGDTTQGVLWRLQNGEGEGFKPKAIMLMIGTNNTSRNSPPEIAEGIEAVVAELRKDFPEARILLLAVFPRSTPGNPLRGKIDEINARIAKLNDLDHIFYLDIGGKFLDADGKFLPGVFRADNLHPVAKGYEIWAEAVKEPLANLLKVADGSH